MASSDDIKLTIEVDAEGGIRALDRFGNEIKVTQDKSGGLEKALASTELKIISLDAALNLARKGFNALQGAFGAVTDLTERGDQFNDVAAAFERLTQGVGATSGVMLNELRQATQGSVTNLDLMRIANDALLAGMRPDIIDNVARAAKQYGDALGKDTSQAINELSNAIQTGNTRVLKQYGIFIDTNQVVKEFAAAHGVAADRISEQGRVLAIQEEALRRLEHTTNDAAEAQKGVGDEIGTVAVTLRNTYDAFAASIDNNRELAKAVGDFGEKLKTVDFVPFIDGLSTTIVKTLEATNAFVEFVRVGGGLDQKFEQIADTVSGSGVFEHFNRQFGDVLDLIEKGTPEATARATRALAGLQEQIKTQSHAIQQNLIPQWSRLADEVDGAREVLGLTEPDMQAVTTEAKKATTQLTALEDINKKLAKTTGDYDKTLGVLRNEVPDVVREQKKHSEELKKQQEILEKINSVDGLRGLETQLGNIIDTYLDSLITIERVNAEIEKQRVLWEKNGGAAEEFGRVKLKVVEDGLKDVDKALEEVGSRDGGAGFFDGLLGNLDSEALKDNITAQLGVALSQGVSGAFNVLRDGRVVREEGAELGAAIGSVIGTAVGLYFTSGNPAGGAAGAAAGAAIGDWLGEIASAFGEDGAGTKARKAADKFFAEIFDSDRLSVIVNGELAQIDDLVFNGLTAFNGQTHIGDELFSSYFDSLEPSARNAFDGVGKAFAEMLGQFDILGTQLGAVFANNIGGSLNNLQLLVQATGKTFEELRGSVVEAFLDGKLSALEAQSAINGIAQVMQDGIPDGVGLIEEAFKNLQAATTKGGRALVDALQDVGFEARELGLKDFPALEAEMKRRMPGAADHIAQVFDTLRQHGIDSIEELTGATVEELLPVLSALEVNEFPFAKATEDLEDLVETARELRDEYRTRIVVDYVKNDPDGVQRDIQEAQRATGQSRGIP